MSRETLHYLTEPQRQSIEGWCEEILPFIDRYSQLGQIDLVVEGGVGTGTTMPHIARRLFPAALYVGTDIAERLMMGRGRRLSGSIDEDTLRRVQAANNFPSLGMHGATIFGNCFDAQLVRDIAAKTGKQHPFLVSFNALNALVDRKMNPWDRKDSGDMTLIEDMVDMSSPYETQLHIGVFWEQTSEDEGIDRNYFRLERAAQEAGWITERFDCGLLILRPSTTT